MRWSYITTTVVLTTRLSESRHLFCLQKSLEESDTRRGPLAVASLSQVSPAPISPISIGLAFRVMLASPSVHMVDPFAA